MNSIFKNNKINADLKEFINRDCSFGVIAVDDDYKILSVNRTFYELTGYPDNELLFNDCRLLIKNDEFDELFDITIFSRSEAAPQNIKLRIANGDFIDACVSLIPLYNSGELINGAVIAFRFGKTGKSDAAELTGQARSSFNEWSTLEAIFNSRLEGAF
ncbi:MAG: PAS domain-containing protein, partial [FCB group bacterium]|nr:PAS domain-containing protein [FCB group bacterium]